MMDTHVDDVLQEAFARLDSAIARNHNAIREVNSAREELSRLLADHPLPAASQPA